MAFLPGNNANPLGRPKGVHSWADLIEKALADTVNGKTRKQIILDKVIELAGQGKEWAVNFLKETVEGKAAVQVNFTSKRSPLANMSDEEIAEAIENLKRQQQAIDVTPVDQKPEAIKALEQHPMPRPTDL